MAQGADVTSLVHRWLWENGARVSLEVHSTTQRAMYTSCHTAIAIRCEAKQPHRPVLKHWPEWLDESLSKVMQLWPPAGDLASGLQSSLPTQMTPWSHGAKMGFIPFPSFLSLSFTFNKSLRKRCFRMKCRRILSKPQTLSQPLWLRDDKIMLTPLISWADLFYLDQHSTSLNEACAQQAGNVSHSGFVSFLPCEWLSFEDIRLSL